MRRWVFACLLPLVLGCGSSAASTPDAHTPGDHSTERTPMSIELEALSVYGPADAVTVTRVPVEGQPFDSALRAEVVRSFPNPWDLQLGARTKTAIQRGDVVTATFSYRTAWIAAETGEGQSEFVVELAREPWTKAVTRSLVAGQQWKSFSVSFESPQAFAAGEAQVLFRLGYGPQTVEVANLELTNHTTSRALADLVKAEPRETYPGMEADAPWRAEAEARIERIRKGDLRVLVTEKGRVVPNVEVEVEQLDHAFGLGTCAPANVLIDPQQEAFREIVKKYFNTVTLENDLKWVALAGDWGPSFKLENAKKAVAWLTEQGIDARGHVLVWPGWKELPKALRQYESDPKKLREQVDRHIDEVTRAMKGSLVHWDVVNEPFDNHDLMDVLGKDEMLRWFHAARAGDPKAKLFLNDYGILPGGPGDNDHRRHFDDTIAFLVSHDAPIDGIGMQGHFGTSLTSPPELLKLLERYGRFGRPIWITEYDIVIDDEELAADYTRDFYTVMFSHEAVGGVVMWGFQDERHWKKNAVMYRADGSLKPAGRVYQELFTEKWRTRTRLTTDSGGHAETRGFLGKYRISATIGAKRHTVIAELEKTGSEITLALP